MKRKSGFLKPLCIILSVLLLLGAGGIGIVGYAIQTHYDASLPGDFFALSVRGESPRFFIYQFVDRVNRVGEATELTDAVFTQRKNTAASIEEIPEDLIHAFVAIEDKRFYKHKGVDWYRTLGAFANHFLGFSSTFGASTITQQVIKNVTGRDEVSPSRKLQEILYALDLERRLDKSQILELYLNVIHFSDSCDGICAAAEHYFSKEPKDLTLAESASIAAITNNPSYYNPIRNPENNQYRRDLILRAMLEQGYVDREAYQEAIATPILLNVQREAPKGTNSWYTDMVIEDVIKDLCQRRGMSRDAASRLVYSGGLRIYTAMDPAIQEYVEDYYENAIRVPRDENGIRAQSSLIVMDGRTGDVLGVAGGVGVKDGNRVQNFATQTLRPPGSTIKPLSIYAPALELGIINWASVYDDVPVSFGTDGSKPWPKNANGVYRGLTNIPYAVAHSTNTVAVRILQELGTQTSYRFAKEKFHLESMISDERGNDCDLAALALGQLNYGVTLRELTAAYSVFADEGVYHPYRSYYRVLDAEGNVLLSNADEAQRVISSGNAAIMTKLLQGVIRDGTSSTVTLGKLVDCAGKTGTSNEDQDRWFVGYTPELICGVWCGYEYPKALEGKQICTQIWNDVMHGILADRDTVKHFQTPSSVISATYCRDSGQLLTDSCDLDPRGSRAEVGWFLREQIPTLFCERHVTCTVDGEHGGVSHGFCPEENQKQVALLKINRSFPKQILVTDAQYVYRGDPLETIPKNDPKSPYFDTNSKVYYGISYGETQFNRSCQIHTEEYEDLSAEEECKKKHTPFWSIKPKEHS